MLRFAIHVHVKLFIASQGAPVLQQPCSGGMKLICSMSSLSTLSEYAAVGFVVVAGVGRLLLQWSDTMRHCCA